MYLVKKSIKLLGDDIDRLSSYFIESHYSDEITRYDEEAVKSVCEFVQKGFSDVVIANTLGVSMKSYIDFLNTHPRIKTVVIEQKLMYEYKHIQNLDQQAADGNFNATKFALLNRGTDWMEKPLPVIDQDESPMLIINMPTDD